MSISNLFQKYIPGKNVICPLCEERPLENCSLCRDYAEGYRHMDEIDRENTSMANSLAISTRRVVRKINSYIKRQPKVYARNLRVGKNLSQSVFPDRKPTTL